jgi:hypothetical protein
MSPDPYAGSSTSCRISPAHSESHQSCALTPWNDPGWAQARGWPAECPGVPLHRQGAPEDPFKPLRRKHLRDPSLERRSLCAPSGQKPRARPSLPEPDAGHPLQGAGISHGREERRAISVQLDRVTSGHSWAVEVCEVGWSTGITGYDLSDSQADSMIKFLDTVPRPTGRSRACYPPCPGLPDRASTAAARRSIAAATAWIAFTWASAR